MKYNIADRDEDEPRREFQSYLFFLRHFCKLASSVRVSIENRRTVLASLVEKQRPLIRNLILTESLRPASAAVRKYLFTAWNAEAVSRLSSVFEPDVKQFTNQWKPVQCYYAIYFQLVALQYKVNGNVSGRHESTLRYATDSILPWFPVPWSLWLDFSTGRNNFPQGTEFNGPPGWNLSNNDPYFHVGNFFRTTARRNQREKWSENYKGKRKRVTAGARKGKIYRIADVPIGRVSIFDVLWRFRRWANYQAADIIIEGSDSLTYAVEFDELFDYLVDGTSILCEAALSRYLGRDLMDELYRDYVRLVGSKLDASRIDLRRELICRQGQT